MRPIISLSGVSKSFVSHKGPAVTALQSVTLDIREGEFFVFVGPSGCGKSTLLRIMSGLEKKHDGTVKYADDVFHADRSFVFQQFALLPWLTVEQNVALPLIARNVSVEEQMPAVHKELKTFGLEKFAHAYPRELSGGMRQRVGFARALVTNPKILFLDEAFSELDSFTATALRKELLQIWSERKMTVVMVSHIVQEAIQMADRIAVMSAHPGHIEQVIENRLPRPRELRSKEFFAMEDTLTGLIHA